MLAVIFVYSCMGFRKKLGAEIHTQALGYSFFQVQSIAAVLIEALDALLYQSIYARGKRTGPRSIVISALQTICVMVMNNKGRAAAYAGISNSALCTAFGIHAPFDFSRVSRVARAFELFPELVLDEWLAGRIIGLKRTAIA